MRRRDSNASNRRSSEPSLALPTGQPALIGDVFQPSLDVRHGFPCAADSGTAVNQHGFFKPLVSLPNLFKLAVRERGVPVVTNGDMLNEQVICAIVRHQTPWQLLV
jgi:hypothetical protein